MRPCKGWPPQPSRLSNVCTMAGTVMNAMLTVQTVIVPELVGIDSTHFYTGFLMFELGCTSFDAHAVAKSLEIECFQKHGKSGRPFYNSQVASTVRWLSTCNWEEFRARSSVGSPTQGVVANEQKPSTTPVPPAQIVPEASELQQISSVESSAAATPGKVADLVTDLATADHLKSVAVVASAALPSIPSFSDYLSKKRAPSSSREEQLFSRPRKKFKPPLMTRK